MAFPTVALLDSFKRANENPLNNGGKWASVASRTLGKILEEAYQSEGVTGHATAYWTPTEFTEPGVSVEMFAVPNEAGKGRAFFIFSCAPTPITVANCYELEITEEGVAGKFEFEINRVVGGVEEQIAKTKEIACAAGDRFGLNVTATKVQSWHKAGAGAWTMINEVGDTNYTKGFIGIGFGGSGGGQVKLRNFEAVGSGPKIEILKASLKPAGALTRKFSLPRKLAASLKPTATLTKAFSIKRTLTAQLKPTGSLGRILQKQLQASLTPTAVLHRTFAFQHFIQATLAPTATLNRNLAVRFQASLQPIGSLSKSLAMRLKASLRPTATLNEVVSQPNETPVTKDQPGVEGRARRLITSPIRIRIGR